MTATAIRYATLTRDGVAVILSSGPRVEWCFVSDGIKKAKELSWVRKGTRVPAGTVTAAFNALPDNVRLGKRDPGEGRLNDWIDGDRVCSISEEVVGLGQYGRTLTVLTCAALSAEPDAETDDDEQDELIERWTPYFRG